MHTSFLVSFTFFRIFWYETDSTNLSLFRFEFGGWDGLVCCGWGRELPVGASPGLKLLVVSFSSVKRFAHPICCVDDCSNKSTGVGPLPVLISLFLWFSVLASRWAESVMSQETASTRDALFSIAAFIETWAATAKLYCALWKFFCMLGTILV